MNRYRLGKKTAKIDPRTIRLKAVLKALPPIPEIYLIDTNLSQQVPIPMFANDRYGDCVIAGRAHQTLRFECKEQLQCIPITDDEVLNEYWDEGCILRRWFPSIKPDRGLILLDSLKSWRNNGWTAGGKAYNIYAFAALDPADHLDLKATVYLLGGGNVGIQVPSSVWEQFNNNQPWDVVPGSSIEGGHCILINGYNLVGPMCITWAKQVQMTWKFWDAYTDEAFAIVDNRNVWQEDSPIDVEKLNAILDEITK